MKHLFTILGYMLVSFAVQGGSHFVINTDFYAGIPFMRPDAIIPMGLATMVLQGLILSLALERLGGANPTLRDGMVVAAGFGLFLASYIAVASPAKYAVPSIPAWMLVEGLNSLVQFVLVGLVIGLIHRRMA